MAVCIAGGFPHIVLLRPTRIVLKKLVFPHLFKKLIIKRDNNTPPRKVRNVVITL